jgi:hypothetical protein
VHDPQGISGSIYVRDRNQHATRAVLKRAIGGSPVYSVGMERVAYSLATHLGLPVSETYLEDFQGAPSSVQIRVEGRTWQTLSGAPMMVTNITNRNLWPLMVVFDMWMANTDRNKGNMFLEPVPPGATPGRARGSVSWLIDHGQCGLWPGWKLSGDNNDKDNIPDDPAAVATGLCHHTVEEHIKRTMFRELRQAFTQASTPVQEAAVDAVRTVDDDSIRAAVREVPTDYFTDDQAATLVAFLQARRDAVDNVVATHW